MRRLGVLSFVVLALIVPAGARATPTVTEYPLPTGDAKPLGITAGPDGALWFAEPNKNRIGRIALDGTIDEGVIAYRQPTGMASAAGALWITEPGGNGFVSRLFPGEAAVTEFTLPLVSTPTGIALGPDGALWVTLPDKNTILRVASVGQVTNQFATAGTKPTGIAAGPDGNLWFTELGGHGTIGRLTPAGQVSSFAIPTNDSDPTGIVAGTDGGLWFTENAKDKIGRITTDGQITEYAAIAGTRPSAITLGADGNVWFTEQSGKIGRVTPDGTIGDWSLPGGADAQGIALGGDGNLWYTDQGRHVLGRVSSGPGVDAGAVTDAADTAATLRGTVRPAAQSTTYSFEYGPTGAYGATTTAANAGAGIGPVNVAATVGGLAAGTTYHYRLVATNATDTTYGPDRTFRTAAASSPLAPVATPVLAQPASDATPPAPVLGKSVVVGASQGEVKVRLKGTSTFVALSDNVSVPTGSELDTTNGAVTLVSALDAQGHSQTGTFSGGRFEVRQSKRGRGMTDLYLRGPKPGRCAAPTRATASLAGTRKKKTRSLWGRDNHGRFRTHGNDSVATVRGTRWFTQDRCDGTLTRVREGSVSVRDLRRKRTKIVRAGQSYLAHRR